MKEKKTKYSMKISRKKLAYIIISLSVIAIIVMLYYIKYQNTNKQTGERILAEIKIDESKVTNEKTERMLKVEKLQKNNSDVIGWLEIEGTKVNYPVVQGKNNDYYLTHDYNKKEASGGSLFLDKSFDFTKPSSNLLIYGHRHETGIMFEDLIKYQEKSFYNEHPNIKFTTNNEESEYEIISVFLSRVYYKSEKNVFRYYFFVDAQNEEEYDEYVKECKLASLYDTGKTAQYGDQLMTLSTCSYHTEDGRLAVVARKK